VTFKRDSTALFATLQRCVYAAGFSVARRGFGLMTGIAWQCIVVSSSFHNDSCVKLFARNRVEVTLRVLTSSLSISRVSKRKSWITLCHSTKTGRKNNVVLCVVTPLMAYKQCKRCEFSVGDSLMVIPLSSEMRPQFAKWLNFPLHAVWPIGLDSLVSTPSEMNRWWDLFQMRCDKAEDRYTLLQISSVLCYPRWSVSSDKSVACVS